MKKIDFIKNQVREGTFLEGLFILRRILHTQINNFYFFRIPQVHVEKRITYTEASIQFCAFEKSNHFWIHVWVFLMRTTQMYLQQYYL